MKNPAEAGLVTAWEWLGGACTARARAAIQAQFADRAHVVPAFGKTEKGYLKVGPNVTAIQHKYDHNATKSSDERLDSFRLSTGNFDGACLNLIG